MKKFLHFLNPVVSLVTFLLLLKYMVYHKTATPHYLVGLPWHHFSETALYQPVSYYALIGDWLIAITITVIIYVLLYRLNHRVHKSLPANQPPVV